MKLTVQLILFGVVSLLSGCTKSGCKKSRSRVVTLQRADAPEFNEAKLLDVSLPVGVTAYEMVCPDAGEQKPETMVFYETDFSEVMLREFYQMDMERLGWKEVQAFVAERESLLVYETPRKIAAISIRPTDKNLQTVMVFVGPRTS